MKRMLLVFLGIFFVIPTVYADNPFDEDAMIAEPSTSDKVIQIEYQSKKEQTKDSRFPMKGRLGWDGVRLREWPWGPIIDKFDRTDLTILGVSGDFYEVEISGVRGYMHKTFIHTPDRVATGEQPYYPGDTWEGGYLSREEGIRVSEAAASNKKTSSNSNSNNNNSDKKVNNGSNSNKKESNDTVVTSTNGISASEFKSLMDSMIFEEFGVKS